MEVYINNRAGSFIRKVIMPCTDSELNHKMQEYGNHEVVPFAIINKFSDRSTFLTKLACK